MRQKSTNISGSFRQSSGKFSTMIQRRESEHSEYGTGEFVELRSSWQDRGVRGTDEEGVVVVRALTEGSYVVCTSFLRAESRRRRGRRDAERFLFQCYRFCRSVESSSRVSFEYGRIVQRVQNFWMEHFQRSEVKL